MGGGGAPGASGCSPPSKPWSAVAPTYCGGGCGWKVPETRPRTWELGSHGACLSGICLLKWLAFIQPGSAHLRQPGRAVGENHELYIRLLPQRGHHLLRHGRSPFAPSPVSHVRNGLGSRPLPPHPPVPPTRHQACPLFLSHPVPGGHGTDPLSSAPRPPARPLCPGRRCRRSCSGRLWARTVPRSHWLGGSFDFSETVASQLWKGACLLTETRKRKIAEEENNLRFQPPGAVTVDILVDFFPHFLVFPFVLVFASHTKSSLCRDPSSFPRASRPLRRVGFCGWSTRIVVHAVSVLGRARCAPRLPGLGFAPDEHRPPCGACGASGGFLPLGRLRFPGACCPRGKLPEPRQN